MVVREEANFKQQLGDMFRRVATASSSGRRKAGGGTAGGTEAAAMGRGLLPQWAISAKV